MRPRWLKLMKSLGARDDEVVPAFDRLVAKYLETHREYHWLGHIEDGCIVLDDSEISRLADDLACVVFAWFYHDLVWYPGRHNNEAMSGSIAWTEAKTLGLPDDFATAADSRIQATTHKTRLVLQDDRLIADVDLAGFAADEQTFKRNNELVRRERTDLADQQYNEQQIKFLMSMLGREHIYYLPAMRERFEAQAQRNIAREIERLRSTAMA